MTVQVKNQIIGNKAKKSAYLQAGALPLLLEILRQPSSAPELLVQSVTAVGSFGADVLEGGWTAQVHAEGVPAITGNLLSGDPAVVAAGVRCVLAQLDHTCMMRLASPRSVSSFSLCS